MRRGHLTQRDFPALPGLHILVPGYYLHLGMHELGKIGGNSETYGIVAPVSRFPGFFNFNEMKVMREGNGRLYVPCAKEAPYDMGKLA